MKPFIIKSAALFCALVSYACGPASWNQHAEYLPAPAKSDTALEAASIREYIADVPPAKILEKDAASAKSHLKDASVENGPEWSRLTLAASDGLPERTFSLHRRSKLLKMSVNSKNTERSSNVHMFQRQRSSWYHWVEVKN